MVNLKGLIKQAEINYDNEKIVRMVCLNPKCKALFKIESNGRRLYYYEKYQMVKKYKGHIIKCPECGRRKTKFDVNYKP